MLNYQTTSFHDILSVRQLLHLRPTPEFAEWLEHMGLFQQGAPAQVSSASRNRLLAQFESALEA
jgi:ethanolamine ammonia-lyase large subunit